MLVQIFEVQNPEEAVALAQLGVDHIGVLVGDGRFPRELSPARAKGIFAAVPPSAKRVALSLSERPEEVAGIIETMRPDILQLQVAVEDFSVEMTRALKEKFPETLIMRAIPVIDETSIAIAQSHRGAADFLLLDSYDRDTAQFGALGRTHDWRLSRQIVETAGIPVILAGGLAPDNVAQAIAAVGPAGVDSKTRTDKADGTGKDLDKVRAFVAAAKFLTR